MTIEEFNRDYGSDWKKFQTKPMFRALIETLRENAPRTKSAKRSPGDIVVGGHVLYAEISGYEQCLELLKTLTVTPVPFEEPESEYKAE